MGILGALKGGADALGQIADKRIETDHSERLLDIQYQAELEKEKRTQEAARANGVIKNQYEIDADNRKLANSRQEMKDKFDFRINQNNIDQTVKANLIGQQAQDAYDDARFPTKLDQETKLYQAKVKPDSALDIQLQQARIAHLIAQTSSTQDGMSAGDTLMLGVINKEIKLAKNSLAEDDLTDSQSAGLKVSIASLERKKRDLLPADWTIQGKGQGIDYAELDDGLDDDNAMAGHPKPEDNQDKIQAINKLEERKIVPSADMDAAYGLLSDANKRMFDSFKGDGQAVYARKRKFLISNGVLKPQGSDSSLGRTRAGTIAR